MADLLSDAASGATLVHVHAVPAVPAAAPSAPIAAFEPPRPCYLTDLFDAPAAVAHTFELAHMRFAVRTDRRPASCRPYAWRPLRRASPTDRPLIAH